MNIIQNGFFIPWPFHSVAALFCGRFILWPFHSVASLFCSRFIPWSLYPVAVSFRGTFILWPLKFLNDRFFDRLLVFKNDNLFNARLEQHFISHIEILSNRLWFVGVRANLNADSGFGAVI